MIFRYPLFFTSSSSFLFFLHYSSQNLIHLWNFRDLTQVGHLGGVQNIGKKEAEKKEKKEKEKEKKEKKKSKFSTGGGLGSGLAGIRGFG